MKKSGFAIRSVAWGLIAGMALVASAAAREEISLAGTWGFALDANNVGLRENWAGKAFSDTITLPGTTDLAKKGDGKIGKNVVERIHPQLVGTDEARQLTRHLSRRFPFVGTAWYRREVEFPASWANRRVTLTFERTKILTLFIDGEKIGSGESLVAPQTFEVPAKFASGRHVVVLAVDNRLNAIPLSGHQVSEDTQTNWNGVVGELKAMATDRVCAGRVRVTPHVTKRTAEVEVTVCNRTARPAVGTLVVTGGVKPVEVAFAVLATGGTVRATVPFASDAALWDEFNPALHSLTVTLKGEGFEDAVTTRFGFCEFRTRGTQFVVNGKPVFLRGRHDGCVWPKTGFAPMDHDAWRGYFKTLKEWGLNHVRCHSWCLPRAAFEVADEMGVYLLAEFGRFGGDFVRSERLRSYALAEAKCAVDAYGNSPSFAMWTFSNEACGQSRALAGLVSAIRAYDPRRLYAQASNADYNAPFQKPGDDFWSTMRSFNDFKGNTRGSFAHCNLPLGRVQVGPADTLGDFSSAVPHATIPLVGHEVGQYEAFPDFREIAKYDGVVRAVNFEIFRDRLDKAGMLDQAHDFFRASAALQAINYREDVELALRTPGFGGFQLLDLQDFPGQGTALVGLLNAFMEPKGAVTPDAWRGWCAPTVLLARFGSYIHREGDRFTAKVQCAHYGCEDEISGTVDWRLLGGNGHVFASGALPLRAARGEVASTAKDIDFVFPQLGAATKLTLELRLRGRAERNAYSLWSYPTLPASAHAAGSIVEVRDLAAGERLMREGRRVLCILDRTAAPTNSIEGFFTSDFWCYPMFRGICIRMKKKTAPGTLGLLVQEQHPALKGFPTDFHSDYQWFDLTMMSVSVILDDLPKGYRPIVQTIDNTARNHRLGLVYEKTDGKGRLVVCGSDLVALKGNPAADQLHASLLAYLKGE